MANQRNRAYRKDWRTQSSRSIHHRRFRTSKGPNGKLIKKVSSHRRPRRICTKRSSRRSIVPRMVPIRICNNGFCKWKKNVYWNETIRRLWRVCIFRMLWKFCFGCVCVFWIVLIVRFFERFEDVVIRSSCPIMRGWWKRFRSD